MRHNRDNGGNACRRGVPAGLVAVLLVAVAVAGVMTGFVMAPSMAPGAFGGQGMDPRAAHQDGDAVVERRRQNLGRASASPSGKQYHAADRQGPDGSTSGALTRGAQHVTRGQAGSGGGWSPDSARVLDPVQADAKRYTCEQLREIQRLSRFALDRPPPPLFVHWYVRCIYEPQVLNRTVPAKFVVYRRTDATAFGWGNLLRGALGAFIVALVSDRVFVLDDGLFSYHFNPPQAHGVEWRAEADPIAPLLAPAEAEGKATLGDRAWIDSCVVGKSAVDIDSCAGRVVVMNVGFSAHMRVAESGLAWKLQRPLFGSLSSFITVGLGLRWMLAHPTARLVAAVDMAHRKLGLTARGAGVTDASGWPKFTHAALQVRFMADENNHHTKAQLARFKSGAMLKCVRRLLAGCGFGPETNATADAPRIPWTERKLFLTTDGYQVLTQRVVQAALDGFATVVVNDDPTSHVFSQRVKAESAAEMEANKRPVLGVVVDWYLLGEASPLIQGRTSFGISAAARTAFRGSVYTLDSDNENCGYEYPQVQGTPTLWTDVAI